MWHLIHRGAVWASGAAQAAQVVRIILRFCGELLGCGGLTRLGKPVLLRCARARLELSAGREDAVDASLPAMRGLFPSQSIEGIFTQAWRADTNDTISKLIIKRWRAHEGN